MFQNIKVDVIYYRTPTDFEMEFNLCGCCRMRLLTDKVSDRKGLVLSLSKAVSRSRVILACGPLFGEDGLIKTVATAIGKSLESADNATYGIADSNEIEIIKGSMPLVSKDGCFGGCIIESGPQVIILLTESKSIRKAIMNVLIHPYIQEFSATPETEPTEAPQQNEDAPVSLEAAIPVVEPVVPIPAVPLAEPVPDLTGGVESAEENDVPDADATEEPVTDEESAQPEVPETDEELLLEENGIPEEFLPTENSEEFFVEPTEPVEDLEELSYQDAPDLNDEFELETGIEPELELEEEVLFQEVAEDAYHDEMYIEPSAEKFSKKDYYNAEYGCASSTEGMYFGSEDFPDLKPRFRVPVLVFSVLLLIVLALLAYVLFVIPLRNGVNVQTYLKNLFKPAAEQAVYRFFK